MRDSDNPFFKMGETIFQQNEELAAANKAIVALSEALDGLINFADAEGMSATMWRPYERPLKEHAPAIEKARGG